jgi:uncharacterized protein involved in response to NO
MGLVMLAAATRMTSDFLPTVRVSHHIYAAWTWIVASLTWLAALVPYLLIDESKPKSEGNRPRRKQATRMTGVRSDSSA